MMLAASRVGIICPDREVTQAAAEVGWSESKKVT